MPVAAQLVQENPAQLQAIDVIEKGGETISLEWQFVDELGEPVTLSEYFEDGRPVILTLGYYQCPKLCNLVFNGISDVIRQLDWEPGREYRLVTVGIDPEEDHNLASSKKKNYWQTLGTDADESGWVFLTGNEDQSKGLADEVGFQYFYDESQDEYAHPAVLILLSGDGKISRYLYGISFDAQDVKLSLVEASQGKVGSPMDKLILYCFNYDPAAGSYVAAAGNIMKLGGGVSIVLLLLFIAAMKLKEKKNRTDQSRVAAYVHQETEVR
jgi:protein SCO1/2